METFSASDFKQLSEKVLIAAENAPVCISKHQVPRYVLMTVETYQHLNAKLLESRKYEAQSGHAESRITRLEDKRLADLVRQGELSMEAAEAEIQIRKQRLRERQDRAVLEPEKSKAKRSSGPCSKLGKRLWATWNSKTSKL